jgi:competence protein ComEA
LAALLAFGLSSTAALAAPVSLNDASKEELTQVKGIGDVLAKRIVAYRKAHDGFDKVAELTEVKGIGEATLADLKGQVALNQ